MIDFVVFSLGCKVNQVEGQSLAGSLSKHGFSVSFDLIPARYYIINTCSVTGEADRKSRQMVARVLKLNEHAQVFIMGCSGQFDVNSFIGKRNVSFVSGTAGKQKALEYIYTQIDSSSLQCTQAVADLPKKFESMDKPLTDRTRAYIKVQDGCNQFCSYCIVPHLRGRSRSRELADIMNEAKLLAAESKEIVLTGINLPDYQIEGRNGLVELIQAFSNIPVRKRIGSLGINVISERLLSAMRDAGFCDHFHLSVQSGSNAVLRRMNRHYSVRDILNRVDMIRRFLPESGIMSDIIAGFPGETEQEFAETIQTIRSANFSDAHVFPYSERRGTKAAAMEQVDKAVRKSRAGELTHICRELKINFLQSQIGKTLSVYIETTGEGYSENYCKVYSDAVQGTVCKIQIQRLYQDGLHGTVVCDTMGAIKSTRKEIIK